MASLRRTHDAVRVAAPEIIVIHGGQIIMHQRVGVQELNGFPSASAEASGLPAINSAQRAVRRFEVASGAFGR